MAEGSFIKGAAISVTGALVGGGIAVGVGLLTGFLNTVNNQEAIIYNTGQAAGRDCLTWQTWVVDRIDAGETDLAITALTMSAIDASAVSDTNAPTLTGKDGTYATSTDSPTVVTVHVWKACGYDKVADVSQMVAAIRQGHDKKLPLIPAPPTDPVTAIPAPSAT